MDPDDPTGSYMLQAGARFCKCLGSEFLPYLPLVREQDDDGEDIEEEDDDDEEVGTTLTDTSTHLTYSQLVLKG